ncbi:hypothetical protein VTL71DRAFT_7477 [Oculimacula yallundae]|uniref:Uncharacterized protein n=1 Tax=Oculimacula yallundae TaxID=86028 RepID=A0ABR4BVW4_9HELO
MLFVPTLILVLYASGSLAVPQGPNTVAKNNRSLRTQADNGTFFIIPIDTTVVQKSVPYPLLPVPTQDASLFPRGFPQGKHPVLVSSLYTSDIRMGPLQIKSLMTGLVYVLFVDLLKDGKTAFQYPVSSIIGGTDGQNFMGVVPALVSTLVGGNTVLPGQFVPDTAAYSQISSGEYSSQGKVGVPNPLSGPGLVKSVYDLDFFTAESPLYTEHTFHTVINQARILTQPGMCLRNTIYFNETFSNPILRIGKVTLYSPPLPAGYDGVYTGVGGMSAQGETIGYSNEDCAMAAKNVDPDALK